MANFSDHQMKIILAAVNILSHQGPHNLTIHRLAKKLDVTDGALYKHFTNKETILTSVKEYVKERYQDMIELAKNSKAAGLDVIKEVFMERIERIAANPDHVSIMNAPDYFKDNEIHFADLAVLLGEFHDIIINIIKDGQNKGKMRKDLNPDNLYLIIFGAFNSFISSWQADGFKFDLVAEGKKYWATIESMCKK